MEEEKKYIEALRKRALGYEYTEVTELIEETSHGTKKKISRVKKHLPPDPDVAKYLLNKLNPKPVDFEGALRAFEKELEESANGNKKN